MKGKEIINHLTQDEMPNREQIRKNCHHLATQAPPKRHWPKFSIMLFIALVMGATGVAYAASDFNLAERLRPGRFEQLGGSHLDTEPILQGRGHSIDWEGRAFQEALRDYGWARIHAGLPLEGPLPDYLWCCTQGQTYMRLRRNQRFGDNAALPWMREGWAWQLTSNVYQSEAGNFYIELERMAELLMYCTHCDDPARHTLPGYTARYAFFFNELAWFCVEYLNSPYIKAFVINQFSE